ncbi:hypothetical protein MKW92_025123 [Papaver armeniacum]|nr:hypothetical protein MKW92_025123 [Papaver armeniacum]
MFWVAANSFNKHIQMTSFPTLLYFLFISLIGIITICPLSAHACHEKERRALLNFKSSLDDPSGRLSTWKESLQHRNCCDWYGIQCSDESLHVISIDLETQCSKIISMNFNSLRGKLSPSLLSINHLEHLDLAFNDFEESEIPFWFSELTKLTSLDLSYTNLIASISTHFSNLSSLQYLDLSCGTTPNLRYSSSCLESPSTKWMRGLVNLKVLRLAGIDLFEATSYSEQNFGDHISYVWNLRDLDISRCNISGKDFPIHQFHNLSHLSSLKMNDNYYLNSSIPLQLCNLTSLSILDLSNCELLHGSIPSLPQLEELDVSSNYNLHSNLTRMFQHSWPRLQKLHMSGTNSSGSIPSSISIKAPLLASLSTVGCSIQGSLHSLISNLRHLTFLYLSDNKLHGSIPNSICENFSLQYLGLGTNNLTGNIPSCITNLRNLTVLDVSYNSIRGNVSLIPLINELNLTSLDMHFNNNLTVVIDQHLYPSKFILEDLRLRSCNMEGFIPTFICKFTHLRILDLSDNNLTGALPSCFYKLEKIVDLNLSKNRLRGPLPLLPFFMENFDLSNNKFDGEISKKNGERLSSANNIFLDNNELSGSIPSSLCSQKPEMSYNVTVISLSNNKLSGIIPASIGNCNGLRALRLHNNNLIGTVPTELQHTSLTYLHLSHNNLNGSFPIFIQKFLSLTFLYLENNNFEGVIPAGLGSLSGLVFLSLRSNRFNGSIPKDIFHLQKLQILDLSLNNFSGPIPSNLGNLTRLASKVFQIYGTQEAGVQYELANKGTRSLFETFDRSSSGFDLSCNNLNGNIPDEIGKLQGLSMLNLSHNHFSGSIPASVGNMSSLGSLDFSSNRLSGHIPQSLTSIDTLGFLNLSHNNLSDRIPRGSHFDTLSLDGSAFTGNDLLCGFPLVKVCDGDHVNDTGDTGPSSKVDEDDQEDGKEKFMLYAIVSMGFVVGFWGLFLVLILKKHKWWFPYWKNIDAVAVRIVECIQKKQQ